MLLIPDGRVRRGQPVQLSPGMIVFGGRGGRGNEGQSQLDGLGTGAAINGGGVSGYGQLENAQEVVMTTAAGLGEAEVGGPIINMIPKTGGNTFQHHYYGSGMKGWMQADNYDQITKDFSNVTVLSPQRRSTCGTRACRTAVRSGSAVVLLLVRVLGSGTSLPGMYYNKNAGDITSGRMSRTSIVPPRMAMPQARSGRRCA
jgi:hypothetical protein